jgi:hypothetical protein
VVTHYKNLVASISRCPLVKLEGLSIKPAGARLLVISERKPKPFELPHLLAVCVSHEVDDVGDAQVSELLDVGPSSYRTAKGQAFS